MVAHAGRLAPHRGGADDVRGGPIRGKRDAAAHQGQIRAGLLKTAVAHKIFTAPAAWHRAGYRPVRNNAAHPGCCGGHQALGTSAALILRAVAIPDAGGPNLTATAKGFAGFTHPLAVIDARPDPAAHIVVAAVPLAADGIAVASS